MFRPLLFSLVLLPLALAAPPSTRHFYTTDPNGEYAGILGFGQRIQTGFGLAEPIAGTIPLYRCRLSNSDYTFLTTSSTCENSGFSLEGVVTNIYPSQVAGSVPLNRYVNVAADHLYWGPIYGGMGCDSGYYTLEGTIGYFFESATAAGGVGQPTALYGFRKGCNNARDPCCN